MSYFSHYIPPQENQKKKKQKKKRIIIPVNFSRHKVKEEIVEFVFNLQVCVYILRKSTQNVGNNCRLLVRTKKNEKWEVIEYRTGFGISVTCLQCNRCC